MIEECYECRESDNIIDRFRLTAVYIYHITQPLESKETYSHRQYDVQRIELVRYAHQTHNAVQAGNEEVEILEEEQQAQIDDKGACQEQLPFTVGFIVMNQLSEYEIRGCYRNDQKQEPPVPATVKKVTGNQQKYISQLFFPIKDQPVKQA